LVTVADPHGGSFTGNLTVTLRTNRPATTHYTLDGSTPTTKSTVANGPIQLNAASTTQLYDLKFFSVDAQGGQEIGREERYQIAPGASAPQPCACVGQTLALASREDQNGSVSAQVALGESTLGGPQVADTGVYGGELYRAILSFDATSLPPSA